MKYDFRECNKGNHPLREIYRGGYVDEENTVVRWCPACGCVVVDLDYDGRTNPGYHMKMQVPEISKRKA